MIRWKIL